MFRRSIYDKYSDALSPVLRKASDINSKILGSQIDLLRITKDTDTFTQKPYNVFGDYDTTWQSTILANVTIQYPFNQIELFGLTHNTEFTGRGLDIMEVLPITIDLQFNGEYFTDPVVMKPGDVLLDVVFDENQNPMPIRMELKRMLASFLGKNIVTKRAEVTLCRGQELNALVQQEIDKYVQKVVADRVFYKAQIDVRYKK